MFSRSLSFIVSLAAATLTPWGRSASCGGRQFPGCPSAELHLCRCQPVGKKPEIGRFKFGPLFSKGLWRMVSGTLSFRIQLSKPRFEVREPHWKPISAWSVSARTLGAGAAYAATWVRKLFRDPFPLKRTEPRSGRAQSLIGGGSGGGVRSCHLKNFHTSLDHNPRED